MDARTWTLVFNTLLLAGATWAMSLPLGTMLAWILVRTDLPGRRVGVAILAGMLLVPLYLQAAAWQAGFGLQGWATLALGAGGWLDGWTGAIWVHALASIPWVVLILCVGFRMVEPELEEQALLDGSVTQVFFRVTLPGVWGAIGVAGLWIALLTAGEMTVTDLYGVRTYAEELYTQAATGPGLDAATLSILPGVFLTALLFGAGIVLVAKLAASDRPVSLRPPIVFRLGHWRWIATALVLSVFLLLVAVPLGNLCYKAGVTVSQTEAGRLRSWSPVKCLGVVAGSPWRYPREFGWSLGVGALAATASTTAAIGLAWLARRGGWRALPALLLTTLCLTTPGPLVGLAIIWLLNQPDLPVLPWLYDQTILAPSLALTVRALPLATLVLWHAFRTLPAAVLEAAVVDGAGSGSLLWRIGLPCRRGAVGVAWIVALAVALGDLASSILVVPPGVMTLSIRIFNLLHYGVEDQVAGISLFLIAVFVVMTALAAWLLRRYQYRKSPA